MVKNSTALWSFPHSIGYTSRDSSFYLVDCSIPEPSTWTTWCTTASQPITASPSLSILASSCWDNLEVKHLELTLGSSTSLFFIARLLNSYIAGPKMSLSLCRKSLSLKWLCDCCITWMHLAGQEISKEPGTVPSALHPKFKSGRWLDSGSYSLL